jgi:hypothetical protein
MPAVVGAVDPDPIICAVLRHEAFSWDHGDEPGSIARFIAAASFHGVLPLLDAEFRTRADAGTWPKEILMACLKATLVRASHENASRPEIARVLDALAADGVQPLLLKGAALAHSHYPEPELRPRNDTDILIPVQQQAQSGRTLERLGYVLAQGVAGELISYQSSWSRPDGSGMNHHLDVHWRINNSQVLAKVLTYPELAARCVPLPSLGASARALAPVDALLHACIHRAGHASETVHVGDVARRGSDRLVWLYDIHLLAERMSGAQFDAFASLAAERRVRALCLDALQRSRECFGTAVPAHVLQVLSRAGPAEPSVHLFQAGLGRNLAGNFLAIDGWRDRMRWLKELALPSADYMRWKYPGKSAHWLPILYLHRAFSAIARQLPVRRDR